MSSDVASVISARLTAVIPTTCDLSFGTNGRIKVTIADVLLIPGIGANQFILRSFVSAPSSIPAGSSESLPVLITGRVYCANRGMAWIGALGTRSLAVRAYEVQEDFVMTMSDEQIVALDIARSGSDLTLIVDLEGTWIREPNATIPSSCQARLFLTEAEWLRQLDQVGTEMGLTIRVPSPPTDPGGALPPTASQVPAMASRAQATARLRKARSELRDGQYENCASTCRLVLDSLNLLQPLPPAKALFDIKPSDRSPSQRWAILIYDLQSLLSMAHHDDELTRAATWNRYDAEAVIAMVAGHATRVLSV